MIRKLALLILAVITAFAFVTPSVAQGKRGARTDTFSPAGFILQLEAMAKALYANGRTKESKTLQAVARSLANHGKVKSRSKPSDKGRKQSGPRAERKAKRDAARAAARRKAGSRKNAKAKPQPKKAPKLKAKPPAKKASKPKPKPKSKSKPKPKPKSKSKSNAKSKSKPKSNAKSKAKLPAKKSSKPKAPSKSKGNNTVEARVGKLEKAVKAMQANLKRLANGMRNRSKAAKPKSKPKGRIN
jgi:hypothetical protein